MLQFIQHEEGRIVMTGASPEYQYHIKDHLGNVRTTFTMKHTTEDAIATLETANQSAEQSKFLRYAMSKRVNSILFDHTNGAATGYSVRLNGTTNERIGLTRSLSVMPGDTIKAEVYAKYVDTNSANWTAALSTLLSQVASNAAGVVMIDAASYNTSGSTSLPVTPIDHSGDSGTPPKAYLNYIFINRNYDLASLRLLPVRMTGTAKESGNDVAHEKIVLTEIVKEAGYVYIYLSNDNLALGGSQIEVYFDDFKVTQVKSPVVESTDYYPMGLEFSNYVRESSIPNQYRFQGMELTKDLGVDLYLTDYRSYDRTLGRWNQIDPKASERESPYVAFANNPLRYMDPKGDTIRDNNGIVAQYRTYVNNRASTLQGMLDNKNFDFAQYGTTREAVEGLVSGLQGVNGELDAMHASTQEYNVSYSTDVAVGEGATNFNSETGAVDIKFGRFSNFDQNSGLVGHEMLHGYQFESGQVSMATNNNFVGSLYDVGDETASYRREHLVAGPISSGGHINNEWVRQRGAGMSPPAYQNMPSGPIDVNSIQGTRLRINTAIDGMFGRPPREVFNGWLNSYNSGRRP